MTPPEDKEQPESTVRLNRYLARAGVASRRAAEALILEGRVEVSGRVITDLAQQVRPGRDVVKVDGKRVRPGEGFHHFALYKPREVMSTLSDPEGRPSLSSYMPRGAKGLFPVGRLDYHSEGLLLLTNEGDLGERLLHPRHHVKKTYTVKVKGVPPPGELDRLRRGITLEGRRTLPVQIRRLPAGRSQHTWLLITMVEGRKNQIREMFFRIKHPVMKLKRTAFGPLKIGTMKPGEVRPLTPEEVRDLRAHADEIPKAPPTRGKPSKGPGGSKLRKKELSPRREPPRDRKKKKQR